MARTVPVFALAAFVLCSGTALAQTGSSRSLKKPDRQERLRDRYDDCRRSDDTTLSRHQRERRHDAQRQLQRDGESSRPRTHASTCSCSPCRSKHRDRTVVVLTSNDRHGGDSVVVLSEGRERTNRGYGRSLSTDYAADFGLSWSASTDRTTRDQRRATDVARLRTHADADCREPGTVLASSGDLYVQVRADGRLTIRSR